MGGLGESEWAMVLLDLGRWIACDGEAVNIVVRLVSVRGGEVGQGFSRAR